MGKSGGGANLDRGKAIMNLILDISNLTIPGGHDEDSKSSLTSWIPSAATRLVMMLIRPSLGWDYIS